MATGKRIKHYRQKAGWKLADLSDACGVDVGTISALENRDSKRSENFAPIARAFGLTVEQLADEATDYPININPDSVMVRDTVASYGTKVAPLPGRARTSRFDKLTTAAIEIMQSLDAAQKFAMLAKMREFKQHLDPPRVGQAL